MSKAPVENQRMQAVNPRPHDTVIDMQGLSSDWLTTKGKVRAGRLERMKARHAQHVAERRSARLRARDDVSGSFETKSGSWLKDPETGELIGSTSEEGGGGGESGGGFNVTQTGKTRFVVTTKTGQQISKHASKPDAERAARNYTEHPERYKFPTEEQSAQMSRPRGAAPTRAARPSRAKPRLRGLAEHRHPATISVRKPLAVRRTEDPETDYLGVDAAALRREPSYDRNINLLRNTAFYPMMRAAETEGRSSDEVAELFIAKAAANYRFMLDHATPEQKAAGGWYRNSKAHLVTTIATQHGFDAASVMGLVSRMSPGTSWDLNVHFADRIMVAANGGRGSKWTPAMAEAGPLHYADPGDAEMLQRLANAGSFDKLDRFKDKAVWMRLVIETDRMPYHLMNRDGTLGPVAMGDGVPFQAPASVSDDNMARGIEMLESGGDREVISRLLGEGHKIRSFYNDLLDPEDGSEVVSDVHNAGGAVMMPVVPAHPVVAQMQGNSPGKKGKNLAERGWTGSASKSATTGVEGLYGLYVEAIRRVARDAGMRPADVQAITWWTKKEMFGKSSAKKQREAEAIWGRYQSGELTFEQTQQAIWDHFTTRQTARQRRAARTDE